MADFIAVVDYGAGNLRSVLKALEHLGHLARLAQRSQELARARGVLLPGVGSSAAAMAALRAQGLVEPLQELIQRDIPFLGVCLGLQLLFSHSEEGNTPCLGVLPGQVVRFQGALKVPHMGWNQVRLLRSHPLFEGVSQDAYFYFVHSYYAQPSDPSVVLGVTDYGFPFASVVAQGNLAATQFHPEKSGPLGLHIYDNFVQQMVKGEARAPWS